MAIDPEGGRPWRTLAGAVLLALSGLGLGFGLTLTAGFLLREAGVEPGLPALVVLVVVLTQGLGFGGVALGYLRWRGRLGGFVRVGLPDGHDLAWIGAGYVLALGGAMLGAAVVVVTGAPAAQNQIGEIAVENPEILLLLVPFSFLLIGPGEELLFRGIVQGRLREGFGPVGAVVLAAAIFAAVHFVALTGGVGGRIVTIGILFLPSLVFGAAYERTGNLVVPAAIHGAYNATLFSLVYVGLRYGVGGA